MTSYVPGTPCWIDVSSTIARAGELGGTTVMLANNTPLAKLAVLADSSGATFAVIKLAPQMTG